MCNQVSETESHRKSEWKKETEQDRASQMMSSDDDDVDDCIV